MQVESTADAVVALNAVITFLESSTASSAGCADAQAAVDGVNLVWIRSKAGAARPATTITKPSTPYGSPRADSEGMADEDLTEMQQLTANREAAQQKLEHDFAESLPAVQKAVRMANDFKTIMQKERAEREKLHELWMEERRTWQSKLSEGADAAGLVRQLQKGIVRSK